MSEYRVVEAVWRHNDEVEGTGWFHGFAQVSGECCILIEESDGVVFPFPLNEYRARFTDHNNLPVSLARPSPVFPSR